MGTASATTCNAPCGCDRPAARSGLCWGHVRAQQRKLPLLPLMEKPKSAFARLVNAAIVLGNAEEDDDYERAEDNLRKASDAHRRGSFAEAVRKGLEGARARGVKLGRPLRVDTDVARQALKEHGTVTKAARALGVSKWTLRRALVRRNGGQ